MAYRFNPPPGWPQPPEGWRPPEGWQPDPAWPPAPEGWEFWLTDAPAAAGGAPAGAPGDGAPLAEAPAAPALDDDGAADDAAVAEQATGAEPATEQFPAEPATEQFPAEPATEQFPAQPATEQFPAQPGAGWGGVPPQAGPSAPQGPGQPAGYAQPGGYQPSGYAPASGYQPGGAQHAAGGYSPAPPPGSGPQFGGPGGGPPPGGPFGPGDAPGKKNHTPLIVGGIVAVVILALLIVLGVRLLSGGDEQAEGDTTPSPTATTEPTDQESTPEPTDDATTPAPTDDATTPPSTDDPGAGTPAGDLVMLAPGESAQVLGVDGQPEVEVALVSVQRDWQPEGSQAMICPEPTGEYIALEFEFTTLPALAEGSGTYSFIGFEVGLANENGTALEASGTSGLFCLSQEQQAPTDVGPGETFTGWSLVDAPPEATLVTWSPFLDFTGEQPTYAWSLADF